MLLRAKRSKPLKMKLLLPLLQMELPSKKLPMLEMLLMPQEKMLPMHRPKPSNKLLKLLPTTWLN